MSWYSDDRLLWLNVAVGLFVAYLYIPAALEHVRTLAKVHEDEEDGKKLSNDAEAALQPEVLRVLADGPSYELCASAIKIVAARALKDDTKKILLRDLASKNADNRVKAINVMYMMLFSRLMRNDMPMSSADAFCDLAGFTAIIDALVNCLPLHDIVATPSHLRKPTQVPSRDSGPFSPLLPPNRPSSEKRLMEILGELLRYDLMSSSHSTTRALQAGVVKRWLNNYPFPCAKSSNSHLGFCRSDVVSLFSSGLWATDDPLMEKIIQALVHDPEASKQLRECGLKASSYREVITSGCGNSGWSELPSREIMMTNSESTAGAWSTDRLRHDLEIHGMGAMGDEILREGLEPRGESGRPGSSWARQAPERSQEEDNLRRRHREAIVVAERGTPFTRENILQRQNSRAELIPLSEPAQELLRVFRQDVENPLRQIDGQG